VISTASQLDSADAIKSVGPIAPVAVVAKKRICSVSMARRLEEGSRQLLPEPVDAATCSISSASRRRFESVQSASSSCGPWPLALMRARASTAAVAVTLDQALSCVLLVPQSTSQTSLQSPCRFHFNRASGIHSAPRQGGPSNCARALLKAAAHQRGAPSASKPRPVTAWIGKHRCAPGRLDQGCPVAGPARPASAACTRANASGRRRRHPARAARELPLRSRQHCFATGPIAPVGRCDRCKGWVIDQAIRSTCETETSRKIQS